MASGLGVGGGGGGGYLPLGIWQVPGHLVSSSTGLRLVPPVEFSSLGAQKCPPLWAVLSRCCPIIQQTVTVEVTEPDRKSAWNEAQQACWGELASLGADGRTLSQQQVSRWRHEVNPLSPGAPSRSPLSAWRAVPVRHLQGSLLTSSRSLLKSHPSGLHQ